MPAGPLLPDDGPRWPRVRRRVRGITLEVVGFAVLTVLLPLALAIAALVDLVLWVRTRKPWMAVRLVSFAWWFLFGDIRGMLGLLALWIASAGRDRPWRRRAVYRLRIHLMRSHLGGVRVLFRLKFEIEDLEVAGPGPVLILIRHTSIIDNTLGDALVGHRHGLGLRFVLKRELVSIPVFDIGGRWVPTNFVRRGSGDAAAEVAVLRKLAENVGTDEAVIIYPEGTRFTPEKLARAQEIVRERQPEVAHYADRLRNVLPPRLGGPLALLDAARELDVVLFGHTGLDGFEYIRDIWKGGLVGGEVRVKLWRFPRNEVPEGADERVAWLYERWQMLDEWVGANQATPRMGVRGGDADPAGATVGA